MHACMAKGMDGMYPRKGDGWMDGWMGWDGMDGMGDEGMEGWDGRWRDGDERGPRAVWFVFVSRRSWSG
jgi:hypothetical protein